LKIEGISQKPRKKLLKEFSSEEKEHLIPAVEGHPVL